MGAGDDSAAPGRCAVAALHQLRSGALKAERNAQLARPEVHGAAGSTPSGTGVPASPLAISFSVPCRRSRPPRHSLRGRPARPTRWRGRRTPSRDVGLPSVRAKHRQRGEVQPPWPPRGLVIRQARSARMGICSPSAATPTRYRPRSDGSSSGGRACRARAGHQRAIGMHAVRPGMAGGTVEQAADPADRAPALWQCLLPDSSIVSR